MRQNQEDLKLRTLYVVTQWVTNRKCVIPLPLGAPGVRGSSFKLHEALVIPSGFDSPAGGTAAGVAAPAEARQGCRSTTNSTLPLSRENKK